MKIATPSLRLTYFIGLIFVSLAVAIPIYLQVYSNINPCPLCILQRITFALLGVIFFFGAAANFKKMGHIFFGMMACLISTLGIVLAGRQVWLQHFPASIRSDCGASLQYLLQVLPVTQVLKKVFIGGAECSQVDWEILGLSLAGWSLICFAVFLLFSLCQLFRAFCKK